MLNIKKLRNSRKLKKNLASNPHFLNFSIQIKKINKRVKRFCDGEGGLNSECDISHGKYNCK